MGKCAVTILFASRTALSKLRHLFQHAQLPVMHSRLWILVLQLDVCGTRLYSNVVSLLFGEFFMGHVWPKGGASQVLITPEHSVLITRVGSAQFRQTL